MALINCPECNRKISNNAPTCPMCGTPIAIQSEIRATGTALTTIQQTSKKFKTHIIVSSLIFWISFTLFIFKVTAGTLSEGSITQPEIIIMIGIFGGMMWYFITKFRIWWHHK